MEIPKKINNFTTAVILGFLGVLLIGFVWFRLNGDGEAVSLTARETGMTEGMLGGDPIRYDFGEVSMAQGNVRHDFILKNDTASRLTVAQMMTSCMCTTAELFMPNGTRLGPFGMPGHGLIPTINAALEPGESVVVRTTFDPAAHGPAGIGPIERQVELDLGAQGRQVLRFGARVTL